LLPKQIDETRLPKGSSEMASKNHSKAPPAKAPSETLRWLRMLARPQYRGPVLALAVVAATCVGLIFAWQQWGVPSTAGPDYRISLAAIHVTPQPSWIHADVRADVVRTGNLEGLNLRDPKLTEQVARAFALHPWVARVERVAKRYPAAIDVKLQYRRPVAAVEIVHRAEGKLLYVDAEGVLLPTEDFSTNQVKDFLRIASGGSLPAGLYGSPWGDERIAGAAQIAALWGERFREAGLYRIVANQTSSGGIEYELRTSGLTRIVWGKAPGRESSREPSPEQKISALLAHVADKGPLDRPEGDRVLDLRKLAAGVPRTAASQSSEAPEAKNR
jgi:hypothetical protein